MISQIFFQDHLKTTLVRKVDRHNKEISITHCSYTYTLSVYIRDKSPNLIVHHHHHINDCSDYYWYHTHDYWSYPHPKLNFESVHCLTFISVVNKHCFFILLAIKVLCQNPIDHSEHENLIPLCDPHRTHGHCCGGIGYHPLSQLCCLGAIQPVSGPRYSCCGKTFYNTGMQLCCSGVVKPKIGSQNYCCGKTPFYTGKQLCCSGVVRPKSRQQNACCGTSAYDTYRQICCIRSIFPKFYGRTLAKCCG